MKVGFTGTQQGMTPEQEASVRGLLRGLGATEFHHGDCIGSDEQAHAIAQNLNIRVVIHPPENPQKRAFCTGAGNVEQPLPYLQRNQRIVIQTEMLIATPKGASEEVRSGTWSTVRFARKLGRTVRIVYPNGSIGVE